MTDKEFQRIVKSLQKAPETIRQLVLGLPDKSLTWKPSDTEFSILEHICHLRDIEKEGYQVRLHKLLTEQQPFLPDIDGDRLAKQRRYNSENCDDALDAFARTRTGNIETIRAMPKNALKRTGVFQNVGTITLERLLVMMREHDEEHRRSLTDLAKQQ